MKTSMTSRWTAALLLAGSLSCFGPLRTEAAFDAFVKFGAPSSSSLRHTGESLDKQFPGAQGWSELSSFGNGILNTVSRGASSGGTSTGQAAFEDFVFTKRVDSGSPILFKACATGAHYDDVELVLRRTGGDRSAYKPFYSAKMKLAVVTKIDWSGADGDEDLTENVAINYGAIQWTYTQLKPDGSVASSTTVNWDIVRNKGGIGPLPDDTASPPTLASLLPTAIPANGPGFTITVNGSSFANGATVNWNGSPRLTTFIDSTQLTAIIPGPYLISQEPVRNADITVVNPGGAASGKLLLPIVASGFTKTDSAVVAPGGEDQITTAPQAAGQSGLKAFLSNTSGDQTVSLSAVNFETKPVTDGTVFGAGSSFVDLQLKEANPATTLIVSFFYPNTITGPAEDKLTLLYFDGSRWLRVRTSGGALPPKDATDNLDQTVSGGRFSVVFDATSTPRVTELSGTVFTMALDITAPRVTAPAPLVVTTGAGANSCDKLLNDAALGTATAVDDFQGEVIISRTGVPPGNVFPVGETIVTYIATDAAGNAASATQSVRVLDDTPPLLAAPSALQLTTGLGATSCGKLAFDTTLGEATASDNCPGLITITRSGVPSGNFFPVGNTTITYTARDAAGNTATAQQTVTVLDNTPPVVVAPPALTVTTGAGAVSCDKFLSSAALGDATVIDNCPGSVIVTRSDVPAGNLFPLGTTTLTYTARDQAGNTAIAQQTVTLIDDTAPAISGINVTPNSLWPPNHKSILLTVNYTATDNCGPVTCSLSASSSHPDKNPRDKDDLPGDIQVVDAHQVWLRAERWLGDPGGRTYTITIFCRDIVGNSTATSVTVAVPRDQREVK